MTTTDHEALHLHGDWDQIDRILWEVWDPIGVHGVDEARDEYRSYIPAVYHALRNGASDEVLESVLESIEVARMGLKNADKARRQATARTLRESVIMDRE